MRIPLILSLFTLTASAALHAELKREPLIRIDQFGYPNNIPKVAVLADPQEGFNADASYTPGRTLEVRHAAGDETVFSGEAVLWNLGKTDPTAGDRGWWFDFSSVTETGDYYIWDPENKVASFEFHIGPDAYKPILKAAMKTFYFQRLAFAKEQPWAGDWEDGEAMVGPHQDSEAHYLYDKDNEALVRDMRGGWMDAGDSNKYVTFASTAVHPLLTAYERNPDAFTDDFDIPESGNGVPDLLDEVAFELEWVRRMQDDDGGVFIKVGAITHNSITPPSTDPEPRFYAPKCSSATICASSMMAHGAIRLAPYSEYSDLVEDMKVRALLAWDWFHSHSKNDNCDTGEIKAGDADRSIKEQWSQAVVAAVYLFELTGDSKFSDYVKEHLSENKALWDQRWGMYAGQHGDALMHYITLPDANPEVVDIIRDTRKSRGNSLAIYQTMFDQSFYRAWVPNETYHWGSLNPIGNLASDNLNYLQYGIDEENHDRYLERALGLLHYFHGVNPMGLVYPTNSYEQGAEECVDQIYHTWFRQGSLWDENPPPGFIPGGPNQTYGGTIESLRNNPREKVFMEFNDGWPEQSWEITENGIYYQASYIKLLSWFVK